MRTSIVVLAMLVTLPAACSAKLAGELTIDGAALALESCRSGAVYGFRGVELTASSGERVRIAATVTGEAAVVLMPKGAATGSQPITCGSLTVADQNSTINDVKNVQGKAELACTIDGKAIKGTVTFENCH